MDGLGWFCILQVLWNVRFWKWKVCWILDISQYGAAIAALWAPSSRPFKVFLCSVNLPSHNAIPLPGSLVIPDHYGNHDHHCGRPLCFPSLQYDVSLVHHSTPHCTWIAPLLIFTVQSLIYLASLGLGWVELTWLHYFHAVPCNNDVGPSLASW